MTNQELREKWHKEYDNGMYGDTESEIADFWLAERTALLEGMKGKIESYKMYNNPIGDRYNQGKHRACDEILAIISAHLTSEQETT